MSFTDKQQIRAKLIRSEAALQNGLENLPLFAASVVAANVQRLNILYLNIYSILYILIRLAYNWVYIWGQGNIRMPALTRTYLWLACNVVLALLFLSPGLKESVDTEETWTYWVAKAWKAKSGNLDDWTKYLDTQEGVVLDKRH